MRLLLLGCTGLVGRVLVPLLAEAGHELVLVSRRAAVPAAGVDAGRARSATRSDCIAAAIRTSPAASVVGVGAGATVGTAAARSMRTSTPDGATGGTAVAAVEAAG